MILPTFSGSIQVYIKTKTPSRPLNPTNPLATKNPSKIEIDPSKLTFNIVRLLYL